jgi:hypothetical protein
MEMYSLKVPLRVLVESTSWVGRSGRVTSYFDRGKLFKISSHNRFLFHRFLILDDAKYCDTTDRHTETLQHQTLQESISQREGGEGERGRPNSFYRTHSPAPLSVTCL